MCKEAKLINGKVVVLVNEYDKPNCERDKYRADPHHDGYSRYDWNMKEWQDKTIVYDFVDKENEVIELISKIWFDKDNAENTERRRTESFDYALKKGINVTNFVDIHSATVYNTKGVIIDSVIGYAHLKKEVIEETQEELLTDLINIYNGNGSILDTFEIKRKSKK